MDKIILQGKEMQELMISSVEKMARVIGSTMGPCGSNVILQERMGGSSITNDGYRIVENFSLDSEVENFVINMVKESSRRCNIESGDGTSSTIMFCYYLLVEGIKLINLGIDPIKLRVGMKIALDEFVKELDRETKKVETIDDIKKIACISGGNDVELAELISGIYEQIGFNGIIQFERIEGNAVVKTIKNGFNISKIGYSNSIFVNNSIKNVVEYSGDCIVWIGDASNWENCLEVIEFSVEQKKPLLIVGHELDEKVISLYKSNKNPINKASGKQLQMSCITTAGNNIFNSEMIEDLIVYLDAKPAMKGIVGFCNGFVSSAKDTLIINGSGKMEDIDQQIERIKLCFDVTKPGFYNDSLSNRINRLNGKLCLLQIGSKTALERGELIDRIEDIIRATKSGIDSGFFVGGAYTMLKIQRKLSKNLENSNKDVQKGIDLVLGSLTCLLKQNLENAGLEDMFPNFKFNKMVYNIKNRKWEKPNETNVLEVNLVMKTALENAISLISTILLSKYLIF